MTVKTWLTSSEAAYILQCSKRTLRRWVADPRNSIRTDRTDDDTLLLNAADLHRVEALKSEYKKNPTFGKRRPSRFGTVKEQRDTPD